MKKVPRGGFEPPASVMFHTALCQLSYPGNIYQPCRQNIIHLFDRLMALVCQPAGMAHTVRTVSFYTECAAWPPRYTRTVSDSHVQDERSLTRQPLHIFSHRNVISLSFTGLYKRPVIIAFH